MKLHDMVLPHKPRFWGILVSCEKKTVSFFKHVFKKLAYGTSYYLAVAGEMLQVLQINRIKHVFHLNTVEHNVYSHENLVCLGR